MLMILQFAMKVTQIFLISRRLGMLCVLVMIEEIVNVSDKVIEFFRFVRGVKISKMIYIEQIESPEFVALNKLGQALENFFIGKSLLNLNSQVPKSA